MQTSTAPPRRGGHPHRRATYASVLRHREFGPLFLSQLQSSIGDRIALVAVLVIVYRDSHSALYTTVAFASTLFTWLVAAPLVSSFGDRWPRRSIMVVSDLCRVPLIALLAIPGLPIAALVGLLAVSGVFAPLFSAAQGATLPEMLEGDQYVIGSSLGMLAAQASWLIGFLVGGAIVQTVSARGALLIDAGTFLVSAATVQFALRQRPAARPTGRGGVVRDTVEGLRYLRGRPGLGRLLVVAVCVMSVLAVPESLAVIVAGHYSRSAAVAGALMSIPAAGFIVGMALFTRVRKEPTRVRLLLPLAALTVLPLLAMPAVGSLPAIAAVWLVAAVGGVFQLPALTLYMTAIPNEYRARLYSLAQSAMTVTTGLVVVAAGALATRVGDAWSIWLAAAAGAVVIGATIPRWSAVLRLRDVRKTIDLTQVAPAMATPLPAATPMVGATDD